MKMLIIVLRIIYIIEIITAVKIFRSGGRGGFFM